MTRRSLTVASILLTTTLCVMLASLSAFAAQDAEDGAADANAAEITFNRWSLDNGLRVMHAHLPDAPRQAIFVFIPIGLALDGKDQAQWSHLIEHMLIRGRDPQGLGDGSLMINGETLPAAMRLEAIATPEKFDEAAGKLAGWLSTTTVDPETLEREKRMIESEEQAVSMNALTHKFAVAAWQQVATHREDSGTVHGDVQHAEAGAVEAAIRSLVPIDARVMVATAGPVDPEVVKEALAKTIGAVPARPLETKAAASPVFEELRARWDLPTKHGLMWWKAPKADLETRAALRVLGRMFHLRLMRQADIIAELRHPAVDVIPSEDGGLILLADLNVPAGKDISVFKPGTQPVFENLTKPGQLYGMPAQWVGHIANELSTRVDFAVMREQVPDHFRDLIEVNWFLQLASAEFEWNTPVEQVREAIMAVDRETLDRVHQQMIEGGSGLLLMIPERDVPGERR